MNTNKTIIVKGLPDHMIRRILPVEVSNSEFAYASIGTILLIPTAEGGTFVVFDIRSEWNYLADTDAEGLFLRMSGNSEDQDG